MDSAPTSPSTIVFAASTRMTLLKKIMFFGIPLLMIAQALFSKDPSGEKIAIAAFSVIIIVIVASSLACTETLKVDTQKHRVVLTRSCLRMTSRTVLDVRFDQCEGGGIERVSGGGDGPDTFHAFLQLKNGVRRRIPQSDTKKNGPGPAEATLDRFLTATSLRRVDSAPPKTVGLSGLPYRKDPSG